MNWENICGTLMFIIVTILTGGKSQDDFSINLLLTVMPLHYNIKLTPHIDAYPNVLNKNINEQLHISCIGESVIMINILKSTRYIRLQKGNLVLHKKEKLISRTGIIYNAPKEYKYNLETHVLRLDYNIPLYPGFYTLKMEFISPSKDDNIPGFFKSVHVKKNGQKA